MKKTLAMMSVLLLAGTLLSGCGKKAVEETTAVPADTQGTTQAETETTAGAGGARPFPTCSCSRHWRRKGKNRVLVRLGRQDRRDK